MSNAVGAPFTRFVTAVSIASLTAAFEGTFVSLSLLFIPWDSIVRSITDPLAKRICADVPPDFTKEAAVAAPVTVKSFPMVTSFGSPTVNVLFVERSCAPVGDTSTSFVVPATSIVLEEGETVILSVPSVIVEFVGLTSIAPSFVLSVFVIIDPDPASVKAVAVDPVKKAVFTSESSVTL